MSWKSWLRSQIGCGECPECPPAKGCPEPPPCPPPPGPVPCPECPECPDCPSEPEPEPPPPGPKPTTAVAMKIVAFCGGRNPRGCFKNGHDWNRSPALLLKRGYTIYLSATYLDENNREIHNYMPEYPGPVEGPWDQLVINGDRIDCSPAWSDGHNITLNGMDFSTRNRFTVHSYGLSASFDVRVG